MQPAEWMNHPGFASASPALCPSLWLPLLLPLLLVLLLLLLLPLLLSLSRHPSIASVRGSPIQEDIVGAFNRVALSCPKIGSGWQPFDHSLGGYYAESIKLLTSEIFVTTGFSKRVFHAKSSIRQKCKSGARFAVVWVANRICATTNSIGSKRVKDRE